MARLSSDPIEFRIASPQSLASRGYTACGGSARAAARADLKQADFIHRARARESLDLLCSFTAHLSCLVSFIFRRAYPPLQLLDVHDSYFCASRAGLCYVKHRSVFVSGLKMHRSASASPTVWIPSEVAQFMVHTNTAHDGNHLSASN